MQYQMKKNTQLHVMIALIICVVSFLPTVVVADELPGTPPLCAAVFPCDAETGQLLDAYSDPANECFSYWQLQCDYEQTINVTSQELTSCQRDQLTDTDMVQKLERKIRRLRRKLRAARK